MNQYFFKLVDAMSDRLYESLVDRMTALTSSFLDMKTLIEESKKAGSKVLVLEVFDSNTIAKSLYTKMGFKDAGRIPKGIFKKGKYIDLLRMTLEL